MTTVAMEAGMHLPALGDEHRVRALLRARLPRASEARAVSEDAPHAYWPAEHFDLHAVGLFRVASAATQRRVLERAGRDLLEEAFFIEKSGVSFAAEMVLLGESIDERMLYGCFAAEEARHFDGVRSFLHGAPPERPQSAFLALLSEVIACAHRPTLQFTIQVVLEGWGLAHYRSLRDGCLDPALQDLLDGILFDEAGHHGSGRVLFGGTRLNDADLRRIDDVIAPMLRMVQLGPQAVLSALDHSLGGIGRSQRVRALEELAGPAVARRKLEHLRQLMRFDNVRPLVERLEARKLFSPLAPEDCV